MEFKDYEDDDERRLKELLDEMVKELSEPEKNQESLHRDFKRKKFEEFDQSSQVFVDLNFLAIHSN